MRKNRKLVGSFLIIALLWSFILPVRAVEPEENVSVINGSHSVDAKWGVLGSEQLITNAQSAILYEPNSETMMYAWNVDEKIYPASLVKIMTALIVAEQGVMTDAVIVRQEVLDSVDKDAVSADLVADEVMTVEDLMYCMMVSSANDAAAVLADHVLDSQEAFVQEMNRYAQELGCTGTNFTNVHGLHNEDQYTTARDMIRILSAAVDNELFCKFFGTTDYTVPATNKSEARNLTTGNYLMSMAEVEIYYDSRVIGGRTGATALGDRCVATLAEKNGMKMLCLITGAKSVYDEGGYAVRSFGGFPETTQLLDKGYDGYRAVQLLHKDQALHQCSVDGGESDLVLGVSQGVSSVLAEDAGMESVRMEYSNSFTQLKAPIEKGSIVASVTLWSGNICIGHTDLYAMNSVEVYVPEDTDSTQDGGTLGTVFTVIGIVVVAFLCVVIALRTVRAVRLMSRRKRARRHSQSRRRSR